MTKKKGEKKSRVYSSSQLDTFLSCPRKYKYKYVDRIKTESTSPALLFGRCIHAGMEGNFSQKVYSREDLPKKKVVDIFAEGMELEKDSVDWGNSSASQEIDCGAALIKLYMEEYSKPIIPMKVEHKFLVPVPGMDAKLVGIIDLLETDFTLLDFKTSSKSPSPSSIARYKRQLAAYTFGLLKLKETNEFTERQLQKIKALSRIPSRLDFLIKTKKPQIKIEKDISINLYDIKHFIGLIKTMDNSIESNIFPKNVEHYLCSPKYCDYWELCKKSDEEIDI